MKVLVKSVNWVGDAVMATPFLAGLRHVWPGAEVTVLSRRVPAAVLEANPDIGRLWIGDERAGWRDFRGIARRIKVEKFDMGFALPNSFASAALMRMGRVPQRIGYNRDGRGWLLTQPVRVTPERLVAHEVDYFLGLLSPYTDATALQRELKVEPAPDAETRLEEVLETTGLARKIADGVPLAGICPGAAGGLAKRWPAERFAAVADHLAEKHGMHTIIVGAPNEQDVARVVMDAAKHPLTDTTTCLPIRMFIPFLNRLSIFVTNDCGSMHLAAARKVPLVAVFGPTSVDKTAPLAARKKILRNEHLECGDNPCFRRECPRRHACMLGVPTEEVAGACDRLLEKQDTLGALRAR